VLHVPAQLYRGGLQLSSCLIWRKNALVLSRGGQNLTVQPARGTMFFEDKPTANAEHPTMKPLRLVARMLANSDAAARSSRTLWRLLAAACNRLRVASQRANLAPRASLDDVSWQWDSPAC